MCMYMDVYVCVCAILTFDFTNFITNHTFLRSISSKKKINKYLESTSDNCPNNKLQSVYHLWEIIPCQILFRVWF